MFHHLRSFVHPRTSYKLHPALAFFVPIHPALRSKPFAACSKHKATPSHLLSLRIHTTVFACIFLSRPWHHREPTAIRTLLPMPLTSSLPPQDPPSDTKPSQNLTTSASTSITSRFRRMDAVLFDYFDVCGSAVFGGAASQPPPVLSTPSKFSSVFHGLSSRFQAFLPRRLHEPTGPWGLVLDMMLSLFVAQGACRSVINSLPLEVVGEKSQPDSPCGHDLESVGVRVPVQKGEKCAICLGCYEEGDAVRHLGCSHAFHAEVRSEPNHCDISCR